MAKRGDDVDVDASEWYKNYPSSPIVFWKDIISTIYQIY